MSPPHHGRAVSMTHISCASWDSSVGGWRADGGRRRALGGGRRGLRIGRRGVWSQGSGLALTSWRTAGGSPYSHGMKVKSSGPLWRAQRTPTLAILGARLKGGLRRALFWLPAPLVSLARRTRPDACGIHVDFSAGLLCHSSLACSPLARI